MKEEGKIIQEDTDHLMTPENMVTGKPVITATEETEQIIETILEDVVAEIKKEDENAQMQDPNKVESNGAEQILQLEKK